MDYVSFVYGESPFLVNHAAGFPAVLRARLHRAKAVLCENVTRVSPEP